MISLVKTLKAIKNMLEKAEVMDVLWENPSPSASFSSQSISVSGDYNEYVIVTNGYTSETAYSSFRLKRGESVNHCSVSIGENNSNNFWCNRRRFASSGAGSSHIISVGSGAYKSQGYTTLSSSDVSEVPVRIYGVRKLGGK
nr:MAG TPA: hypothetical protein [Caudoviricetes sp.]